MATIFEGGGSLKRPLFCGFPYVDIIGAKEYARADNQFSSGCNAGIVNTYIHRHSMCTV